MKSITESMIDRNLNDIHVHSRLKTIIQKSAVHNKCKEMRIMGLHKLYWRCNKSTSKRQTQDDVITKEGE
jgi:hypothetical protein